MNIMINPELVLAHKFPETKYQYSERDAALYALGVGACGTNAVDANELKYVYHGDGQQFIKVLPTFAAILSLSADTNLFNIPGMEYDPRLLLHGQQYIEIYRPLPSNSCIRNTTRVAGLHDKGKAAILEIEMTSFDEDSKEPLCMNRSTIYFRGAGGFSRSSPPYTFTNYSGTQLPAIKIPKSQPFASFEDVTRPSQALLYRLSGDYNPLHSDPMVAETAGFPRPILHGLCSLGYAIRAIIKCICKGNSDMVKSLSGRFLLHVFPGETLITEMWLEGLRVIYQVNVKERNKVVLSGHVDLNLLPSHL
ncbi:enoyl-CoA hydratase 2, peroxisomal-like [Chenopodium quinoa]|uniref:enoyl-CoA hydratase 2, peroxisomal-like n=1 Tax=Chenopodium quinoa TaxID=63459 RepID=UPI000B786684|nr:enoyl-CoA hydratase 2, peroxisomal-like [Chenopodium quinoa]XP_021737139.1 enoyl-CoA hydratase 2, peroxisomal-like [Chenopodium quinoa]